MADNVDGIFGGYAPNPDPQYILTPKAGLKRLGRTLGFAEGCKNSDPKCVDYDAASLKEAVRGSQLVIVCLGTGQWKWVLMKIWQTHGVIWLTSNFFRS